MTETLYSQSGATLLPEDYEMGFLDLFWWDESDRRYILGETCSAEAYYTTRDAIMFEQTLENGSGSPPAGMPIDIADEIRESHRQRQEG